VTLFVKGLAVRKTIVASLILAPSLALASGYSLPNTNPRDLGLCASSVAAQRDAGAAFALPAALSRLDGPSLRLAGGGVNVFNTWKDPTGAAPDTDMGRVISALGNLDAGFGGKFPATVPFLGDRGWGVGLGIQPFGGAIVDWPDDWTGRYRIVSVDRKVFSGALTGGLEVLPQVRLGGGLLYYFTTQKFTQKFCVSCATGAPLPDGTATLELDGGAFSYDVSAEIDPVPGIPLRIGVDYKHKATQDLDGDVKWEGIPAPLAAAPTGAILNNQDVSQTLTIPNLLNIGVAYRVTQPLLLTFTFTFDRWVVYDADDFIGTRPGARLTVRRDYRSGQTYRGGAEYDLSSALQVRAGVQRDVSGLRTSTYSPTLPDGSSWAGSLGATYKFGRGFSVDGAVFYAMMDDVTATNVGAEPSPGNPFTSGTLRGKYSPSALVYGVALNWQPRAAR
jgi:long-chain fatty acid transport protein